MKKFLAAISAFLVAFSISGCGKNNDVFKNSPPVYIAKGNNFFNNGCVFYEGRTKYLDFDSLVSTPICAVPNCTHSDLNCLSVAAGDTPIFYDDHVYYLKSNNGNVRETPDGQEFFIDSRLERASLSSSQTELVCEFHDCAPEQGFIGMVLKGNVLYFTGDDLNPQKGEYGGYCWCNSGGNHYLCSIDLDTGKYTNYGSIYDGDKEYDGSEFSSCANITGVYKDKMYIRYSFIKDFDAVQNHRNVNIDSLYTHMNFEFDFETNTWTESELPFGWSMNENTYAWFDENNGLMHVIYNDMEKTFSWDDPHSKFMEFNGKLFAEDEKIFIDMNDMSRHSYDGFDLMGVSDEQYIFRRKKEILKITEPELFTLETEEKL